MDLTTAISSALILLGAALMFVNILRHRQSILAADKIEQQTQQTQLLVTAHLIFMVFFLLGYLAVLYLFVQDVEFSSSLFVALIFFFGAIFVFMGIVIQKRMFSKLQKNNEALHKFNDRLVDEQARMLEMNEHLKIEVASRVKAEEADQIKSDFLSLVSHELRTPLTSIFGFTKLLEKRVEALDGSEDAALMTKEKERISGNLFIISDECCRLTRLINNVLDLAKIEAGKVDWDDHPVPLLDLVDSALNASRGLFTEKDSVSIELDIPDELPTIKIDSDLFSQVLINILSNAVKYTDNGIVSLAINVTSEVISIVVSDQGEGIPPVDLSKIFDKFYMVSSGDTRSNDKKGTGLGLPICKQIVEHYDGHIWAESDGNSGSSFHVTIPASLIVT